MDYTAATHWEVSTEEASGDWPDTPIFIYIYVYIYVYIYMYIYKHIYAIDLTYMI
jgi:hypothetical protein